MNATFLNRTINTASLYTNHKTSGEMNLKFNFTMDRFTRELHCKFAEFEIDSRLPTPTEMKADAARKNSVRRFAEMKKIEGDNKRFFSAVISADRVVTESNELGKFTFTKAVEVSVDIVMTSERVVALVTEYASRNANKFVISFDKSSVVDSGLRFRGKTFFKKPEQANSVTTVIVEETETLTNVAHVERALKAARADVYGAEAEAIIKAAKQLIRDREIAAMKHQPDNGREETSKDEIETAFAQADIIVPVAKPMSAIVEATETEAATVAPVEAPKAVETTVEATNDEDEFDFLDDAEERRKKLIQARLNQNRREGVVLDLMEETETRRRADEEERSVMAYQQQQHEAVMAYTIH